MIKETTETPKILGFADKKILDYPSIYDADSDVRIAENLLVNMRSRIQDKFGSGEYGASRDRGTRSHKGIDIITSSGEEVYAPFEANIIRQTFPYKNDPSYEGVVLQGTGKWKGYEAKVFYVTGLLSGPVKEGMLMAHAQDLTKKYPGITNHLHFEIRLDNSTIDPFEIWQMSF